MFPLLVLGIRDYNLVTLLVYIDKDETICSDSYNIKPLVFTNHICQNQALFTFNESHLYLQFVRIFN